MPRCCRTLVLQVSRQTQHKDQSSTAGVDEVHVALLLNILYGPLFQGVHTSSAWLQGRSTEVMSQLVSRHQYAIAGT